ncbi:hypothetical protein KR026_006392 [Drosophila bipectinata]|nr:hypothetical protein KR026_006392 [Drosophila bipectinata]
MNLVTQVVHTFLELNNIYFSKIIFKKLQIQSKWEFTNFVCESLDKDFGEFEYCFIKSVNRSYKYISGKFKLYQRPLTKLKINMALLKRFNGYKPFLYNLSVDLCKFYKNPKSNIVLKFFYESYSSYAKHNRSCPLNGDIILDKLPSDFINHRATAVLPFPEGNYLIEFHWLINGTEKAVIKLFGTLS